MSEREEVLDLVEGYRALKAQFGLMDFSDQIALAAELARTQPEVGRLEREKYRVVLLDEYQDTSVAQAELLSTLFSGADAASGRGHAVTAVGDPNQAIYGWRGASVSNILGFGSSFPSADGAEVPSYSLTVNRRSDSRILDVANALAQPLYDGFDQVQPLRAKDGAAAGAAHAIVHETYHDELAWLADQVMASHAAMPEPLWSEVGVLTRDNNHAADVFDALTSRGIPVEIVGLKGLMRLPEVSEVVSTLALLQDLTANADLLNLLNGPRWAIGPRDLALLGKRARTLTGLKLREDGISVADELQRAVEGADPTEVLSLNDALADPGDLPYSEEARTRFALLSEELRQLRTHIGEPLLDLVRRIIDVTGIDVELASSVSLAAAARRDNLDLFVKAVAEFQAIDGRVTLASLLAWLEAEDEMGSGLDQATPSEADSVKLLTVHRAKGLEWSSVFLVGVCAEKFPVTTARSQWTTVSRVLPAPLRGDRADVPQLRGYDKPAIDELKAAARAHQGLEELRLGYVAFTRAKHELWVSAYQWSPTRQKPLAPSPYLLAVRDAMAGWGAEPDAWPPMPEDGTPNPLQENPPSTPWPTLVRTEEHERRLVAAGLVREAMATPDETAEELDLVRGLHGRPVGRGARAAARRGSRRPWGRGRGAAAQQPVGNGGGPAARRPGAVRPRDREADAAQAVTRCAVRDPFPRLGRGALRPAVAARPRRAPRPGRPGHRRRGRAAGADRHLRGRPVRRAGSDRRGAALRPGAGRPGGPRPHRRGVRRAGRGLAGRRLEDQPAPDRRPAAAGDLPPGLGRAHGRPARGRASGVPLRPGGRDRRDQRPGRPSGAGADPPAGRLTGLDQFRAMRGLPV